MTGHKWEWTFHCPLNDLVWAELVGAKHRIATYCEPQHVSELRLIEAAPALLEALQAVLSVADRSTVEFDLARAAIEKATQP